MDNNPNDITVQQKKNLNWNYWNSIFQHLNLNEPNLIKPCKCGNYAHIPCLLQYCILHLTFKCDECNNFFNFIFKSLPQEISAASTTKCKKCSLTTQSVFTIFFHWCLLVVSVIFCAFNIFPDKFRAIDILFGVVLFGFNVLLIAANYQHFKAMFQQLVWKEVPIIEDSEYKFKNEDTIFKKMETFLMFVMKANIFELIEKKNNSKLYISSTVNLQSQITQYISDNNNEAFEAMSERVKDGWKKEDLEEKFHGHQIIKSTLIGNNQEGIKGILSRKGTKTSAFGRNNNASNNNDKVLVKSKTKNINNIPKKDETVPRRSWNTNAVMPVLNSDTKNDKDNEGKNNNETPEKDPDIISIPIARKGSKNEAENVNQPTIEQQAMEKWNQLKNTSSDKGDTGVIKDDVLNINK